MIRFCKGTNLYRWNFTPTIELERYDKCLSFLCVTFLKWYVGITIDREGLYECEQ